MLGLKPDQVAWALGITIPTLGVWVESHPELREYADEGKLKDLELIESAFDLAVGYKDDQGRRVGASSDMCKFLLKNRLGMRDKPDDGTPEEGAINAMMRNPEALKKAMRNLLDAFEDEEKTMMPTSIVDQ